MIIALLGKGTIGSGVFEQLQSNGDRVKWVLDARFSGKGYTDDFSVIEQDPEVEIVIEALGGTQPAYDYACRALKSGKHFITANKLLVGTYGAELTKLACETGMAFYYTAACGGALPYLYNLALARQSDRILSVGGIMNGTTNYILNRMESDGLSYQEALLQAQALGYAERDPASDVDGLDTARKLILACAVGLGITVREKDIPVFGISSVSSCDHAAAESAGCVIRLCALASDREGVFSAIVRPVFVPKTAPEAGIRLNNNYIWYEGLYSGLIGLSGQGAGKHPTASNIIRDVNRVRAGEKLCMAPSSRTLCPDREKIMSRYYIRFTPGTRELPLPTERTAQCPKGDTVLYTAPIPLLALERFSRACPGAFIAEIS